MLFTSTSSFCGGGTFSVLSGCVGSSGSMVCFFTGDLSMGALLPAPERGSLRGVCRGCSSSGVEDTSCVQFGG